MNANENLAPMVVARLMKDIRRLCKNPPEGITLQFNEESMTTIHADILGPEGTPYEGGVFKVKLCLTHDFPHSPPKGYFLTKIFHPNISDPAGEICVNTLKRDWKAEHGIEHVLIVIRCLLIFPNPESALNEEAGRLLLDAYEEFAKRARLMTHIHAKPKPESSSSSVERTDSAVSASSSSSSSSSAAASSKTLISIDSKPTAAPPAKKLKSKNDAAAKKKSKKKAALKRL